MSILVVVADASRARFFSAKTIKSEWQEMSDLLHPSSRLKGRELETDAPGRSFDSAGQGRHAMSKEVDAKKHEQQVFGRELKGIIEKAIKAKQIQKLYLVAAPAFLGEMRGVLDERIRSMVAGELSKNLVKHDISEIKEHLSSL